MGHGNCVVICLLLGISAAKEAYAAAIAALNKALDAPASAETGRLQRLRASLEELQTQVEVIAPQLAVLGQVYTAVAADINDHIAFLESKDVDVSVVSLFNLCTLMSGDRLRRCGRKGCKGWIYPAFCSANLQTPFQAFKLYRDCSSSFI